MKSVAALPPWHTMTVSEMKSIDFHRKQGPSLHSEETGENEQIAISTNVCVCVR